MRARGRKRADAERISKYIGSLGEISSPPHFYYVYEAAQILGCSYLELEDHPRKTELMTLAFTISRGKSEGEYMRELNPKYVEQRKSFQKQVSDLNK